MKIQKTYLLIVAIIAVVAVASAAIAATYISAPEHVTGTPQATPTPTPTQTPTPTPTPIELHVTSNNTAPFYIGDTLHITATLSPAQAGITVTLYNNGASVATATTNTAGQAVFDRKPSLAYDYTAVASLP